MENDLGARAGKTFKIAVVGSEPLTLGLKMTGVVNSYVVESPAEAETRIRELLQRDDIGIIVITSRMVKSIKDRRLSEAMASSILPLIVEVPDYDEESVEEDTLRRLILRAIGIDISKGANA